MTKLTHSPDELLALSQEALNNGDFDGAIALAENALDTIAMAEEALDKGDFQAAFNLCQGKTVNQKISD